MKRFFTLMFLLAFGVSGPWSAAWGQDEPAAATGADSDSDDLAAEVAAIRQAIDSYVSAFNAADAANLAAHWSPEGELITPQGKSLRGRKQLEDDFRAYFAETQGAKLELVDPSVTLISPAVGIETGIARVTKAGELPVETDYEVVHVKTAEGWKMDRVRENSLPTAAPTHYDRLQELEWMVGEWRDTDENSQIETSCRWTTNRNFLVRSFRVYIEDRVDFEGTQVIGWDPSVQTIRSWLFDSDGGFGVGRWSGGGPRWTVQTLNVLPDGRRGSATNVFERIDEHSIRFQSIGRQVEGELLPNIDPVVVIRQTE